MGAILLVWAACSTIASPFDDTANSKRAALRAEAEAILDDVQNLEITAGEARRRVELLRQALRRWARESGLELHRQSRTYSSPPKDDDGELSADNCPLFFKENIEEDDDVCPLDLSRSEVWGASVMFCRYDCAPKLD